MNENLNLVEILKDCPKGTKLYSTVFGEVEFDYIENDSSNPINVKSSYGIRYNFTIGGELYFIYNGECTLFPSKEQRDWSKFKQKKEKFDPKTLQPYDKVLVRNSHSSLWQCNFFFNIRINESVYSYNSTAFYYEYCIPYNNDTKHLAGTTDEAPEYYRYWED